MQEGYSWRVCTDIDRVPVCTDMDGYARNRITLWLIPLAVQTVLFGGSYRERYRSGCRNDEHGQVAMSGLLRIDISSESDTDFDDGGQSSSGGKTESRRASALDVDLSLDASDSESSVEPLTPLASGRSLARPAQLGQPSASLHHTIPPLDLATISTDSGRALPVLSSATANDTRTDSDSSALQCVSLGGVSARCHRCHIENLD